MLRRPVRLLLTASVLAAPGCSLLGSDGEAGVFAGTFSHGFEVSAFEPCDEAETWWVSESEGYRELFERYAEAVGPANEYAEAYVRIRGDLTGGGEYGHLGAYDREVSVEEVLEVRALTGEGCE